MPVGWWPDGKSLVLKEHKFDQLQVGRTLLSRFDWATDKQTPVLSKTFFEQPAVSPDGKSVLGLDNSSPSGQPDALDRTVLRHDLAAKSTAEIVSQKGDTLYGKVCWSFDGRRLVYDWTTLDNTQKQPFTDDRRFVVCDPDGKNAVTIHTEKRLDTGKPLALAVVAWTPTPPALKDAKTIRK